MQTQQTQEQGTLHQQLRLQTQIQQQHLQNTPVHRPGMFVFSGGNDR
ncbi:TPA: DUF2756 domain-containing protein [Klebsiella oxytoca]|uniref:DUF2756 domain-containing protein n=1 Tax=Klebsiella oxytoca TaxID=571 RepID=A0AAN5LDN3_KLEOX|nr:DUF2756 domain-containing protein [Klebsiella oxytoca]